MPLLNPRSNLNANSLMVNLENLERQMVVCRVVWRFGRTLKDWQIDHLHTQKGRQE